MGQIGKQSIRIEREVIEAMEGVWEGKQITLSSREGAEDIPGRGRNAKRQDAELGRTATHGYAGHALHNAGHGGIQMVV